jgi:hypothetical protein
MSPEYTSPVLFSFFFFFLVLLAYFVLRRVKKSPMTPSTTSPTLYRNLQPIFRKPKGWSLLNLPLLLLNL